MASDVTLEKKAFQCPKCNGTSYEKDQFQAVGGFLSKILDIQNRKFITITCSTCGFTEIYKAKTSTSSNVLDFLVN